MPAIFVYDGKETTLLALDDWKADLVFGLFQNDLVPDEDTGWGDVVIADFSGFAEVSGVTWGPITEDAFGRAVQDADGTVDFDHNGGGVANVVYGYYVRTTDFTLQFIERFAAPRSMGAGGDMIKLLPRLLDGHLAPP